jgi:DNA-binding beta-propeller fold protein YncE
MPVVDPATNQVQETLPASGSGPVGPDGPGLAFASGNLWVANTDQGQVARDALDTDATAIAVSASPVALATSPDVVWVVGRAQGGGLLARIDALTNQVDPTVRLPHSSEDDTVMRVDAASDAVQAIPVGNGPTGIAFGEDRVWVANGQDGTVSSIDPETNQVGTLQLGFRPAAVAVVQGAVWVALAA